MFYNTTIIVVNKDYKIKKYIKSSIITSNLNGYTLDNIKQLKDFIYNKILDTTIYTISGKEVEYLIWNNSKYFKHLPKDQKLSKTDIL